MMKLGQTNIGLLITDHVEISYASRMHMCILKGELHKRKVCGSY